MHTVKGNPDARSVFEWRTAYNELAGKFITFADHLPSCKPVDRTVHDHDTPMDNRIRCDKAPCTCGLNEVLQQLKPTVPFTIQCPNQTHEPISLESPHRTKLSHETKRITREEAAALGIIKPFVRRGDVR